MIRRRTITDLNLAITWAVLGVRPDPAAHLGGDVTCPQCERLRSENAELREARRNIEARLTAELREAAGKYVAVIESGRREIERLLARAALEGKC